MVAKTQGGWGEYRALILEELKRLHGGIEEVKSKIDNVRSADIAEVRAELAVLKDRAGRSAAIWGAIGGAVIAAMVSAFFSVLHK